MLRIDTQQRRCWFLGVRLHHGLVGAGAVILGIALAWHDRADFPWLRDNP